MIGSYCCCSVAIRKKFATVMQVAAGHADVGLQAVGEFLQPRGEHGPGGICSSDDGKSIVGDARRVQHRRGSDQYGREKQCTSSGNESGKTAPAERFSQQRHLCVAKFYGKLHHCKSELISPSWGKRPVWYFEKISLPSIFTSNTPLPPSFKMISASGNRLRISFSKLEALGK